MDLTPMIREYEEERKADRKNRMREEMQQRDVMEWFGLAAMLLFFTAFVMLQYYTYLSAIAFGLSILCMFVFVFSAIEFFILNKRFTVVSGTLKIAYAVIIAVVVFAAKIQGQSDVNSIFHLDASALPETVIVASVLNAFYVLRWPFLGLIVAFIWVFPKEFKRGNIYIAYLTLLLPTIIIFILLGFYRLSDDFRKPIIYRFAHISDFSSSFQCQGIDNENNDVLFIGPEQRNVLIAPKVFSSFEQPLFSKPDLTFNFLKDVQIPDRFPVVQCIPVVDYQCWRNEKERGWPPANYERCVKL